MTSTITVGCYTDLRGLSQEDKLRVLKVYKDAGYSYLGRYGSDLEFLPDDDQKHPFLATAHDRVEPILTILTESEIQEHNPFGHSFEHIPAKDILESIMNKSTKKRVYAEAPYDSFHYIKEKERFEVVSEDDDDLFKFLSKEGHTYVGLWQNCPHLKGGDWKRIEIEEDTLEVGAATAISSSPSQCLLARIRDAKLEADKAEQKLIDLLKEADEILGDTNLRVDIYR